MACDWYKEWRKRIPMYIDGTSITEDLENVSIPIILSDSCGLNNADLSSFFDVLGSQYTTIFHDDFSLGGENWYDTNYTSYYDDGYLKHTRDYSRTRTNDVFELSNFDMTFSMKQHGRSSYNDQFFVYPIRSQIHDSTHRTMEIYMRTYSSYDNYVRIAAVSSGWQYSYFYSHKYNYYNMTGIWFSVRFKRIEDYFYFKIWESTEPEPTSWDWQANLYATHVDTFGYIDIYSRLTSNTGTGFDNILITGLTEQKNVIEITTEDHVVCDTEVDYQNNIEKEMVIWARVPKIYAGQQTKLFLYYDGEYELEDHSARVWRDDFVAVYHCTQYMGASQARLIDSTDNAIDGVPYGSMTPDDLVDGIAGKALDFDGSNDYIRVNDIYSKIKESDSTITIYVVFKFDESDGSPSPAYGDAIFSFNHGDYRYSNENSLLVRIPRDGTYVELILIDKTNTEILHLRGTSNICDYSWHCVVATYDNDTQYGVFYVDGMPEASGTATSPWPLNDTGFASIAQEYDYWGASDFYNGKIDELHIRNTAVNSSWVSVTTSGVFDNLIWYGEIESILGFRPRYKNIWVTDDYIFQCVSSGIKVFNIDTSPLGFIDVCYRPSSVWADDNTLYISTTVSGIFRHPITSISGGVFTDLEVYKQYPDITNNGVNYIHGAGDFFCATTVSGVDQIRFSNNNRIKLIAEGDFGKCHQVSTGELYYITHYNYKDFPYDAKYCRKINFSGQVSRSDYQIMITLTLNNFDFDHINMDASDIRFFSEEGSSVPYYIESVSSSEINIWIRPSLWSSYVYMLYGKNNYVTSESDPHSVFNLFDPFTEGVIDPTRWTIVGDPTKFSVTNGVLSCTDCEGDYLLSSGTVNFPLIIEQQFYKTSGVTDQINYVTTITPYEEGLYWYKGSAIARKILFNGSALRKPTLATFPDGAVYKLVMTISANKIQMEVWKGTTLHINDVWVGETNGLVPRHLKIFGGYSPGNTSFRVDLYEIRVRGYDPQQVVMGDIEEEHLLTYSKLNVLYDNTTDWTETSIDAVYDGDSDFFPTKLKINDLFVTENTTTSGNTIFLATTNGAVIIEENRGDEMNSRRRFYKIR